MSEKKFIPINISVLTVSDTRNEEDDYSGKFLVEEIVKAGHNCKEKKICKDDIYEIRSIVSQWIVDKEVHGILITGGTGLF